MPGRLPGARPAARPGPAGRRAWSSPPAATRRPRPSGPPGRPLPVAVVPPGRRRRPLPPARRRGARPRPGRASACPPTAASCVERQPARAPQGHGRADRGGGPPGARPHPTCVVAIGGCGPRPRAGSTGSSAAPAPRSGSSAGCPTPTCPPCYGCADVFAMLCRNRWGGLEQEGFGIVFLEAAAVRRARRWPGDSGGAAEAVVDGETGLVVDRPDDADGRRRARSAALLDDADRRRAMGAAGPRAGRATSSPTTCWPRGWPGCWTGGEPATTGPPDDDVVGAVRRRAASVAARRRAGRARSCGRRVGDARLRGGVDRRGRCVPDPLASVAVPVDLVLFVGRVRRRSCGPTRSRSAAAGTTRSTWPACSSSADRRRPGAGCPRFRVLLAVQVVVAVGDRGRPAVHGARLRRARPRCSGSG